MSTMRTALVLFLAAHASLSACSEPADNLREALQKQEEKVTLARSTRSEAATRLKAMEDSLDLKIAQNIALGMSKAQAAGVEQTLIESQRALVKAAEKNLGSQIKLLERLRSLPRAP